MDAEAAGRDLAVLIRLGALEDEDVLVAGMEMVGNAASGMETEEGGGGPFQAIAIEAVNLDALMKWLPRQTRLPLAGMGKIQAFQKMVQYGWMRGGAGHRGVTVSSPLSPCTAEKTGPRPAAALK